MDNSRTLHQSLQSSFKRPSKQRYRLAFRQFLCLNGARYYGLPVPQATFELERLPDTGGRLATPDGEVVSLAAGLGLTVGWRVRSE